MYVMDTDFADATDGTQKYTDPKPGTVLQLRAMLEGCNEYARTFKSAGERIRDQQANGRIVPELVVEFKQNDSKDKRTYQAPLKANFITCPQEIAALIVDNSDDSESSNKDFRRFHVITQSGDLQSIISLNEGYDALHYPLLSPHGESQWSVDKYEQEKPDAPQAASDVSDSEEGVGVGEARAEAIALAKDSRIKAQASNALNRLLKKRRGREAQVGMLLC
jgi:hypothetical protein